MSPSLLSEISDEPAPAIIAVVKSAFHPTKATPLAQSIIKHAQNLRNAGFGHLCVIVPNDEFITSAFQLALNDKEGLHFWPDVEHATLKTLGATDLIDTFGTLVISKEGLVVKKYVGEDGMPDKVLEDLNRDATVVAALGIVTDPLARMASSFVKVDRVSSRVWDDDYNECQDKDCHDCAPSNNEPVQAEPVQEEPVSIKSSGSGPDLSGMLNRKNTMFPTPEIWERDPDAPTFGGGRRRRRSTTAVAVDEDGGEHYSINNWNYDRQGLDWEAVSSLCPKPMDDTLRQSPIIVTEDDILAKTKPQQPYFAPYSKASDFRLFYSHYLPEDEQQEIFDELDIQTVEDRKSLKHWLGCTFPKAVLLKRLDKQMAMLSCEDPGEASPDTMAAIPFGCWLEDGQRRWTLQKLKFHAPAEHMIRKHKLEEPFAHRIEMQLIHLPIPIKDKEEDGTWKDIYESDMTIYERSLIVSVFFEAVPGASHPLIGMVAKRLPEDPNGGSELISSMELEIGQFDLGGNVFKPLLELSKEMSAPSGDAMTSLKRLHTTLDLSSEQAFVYYSGSSTTPPCDQNIDWLVARYALPADPEDVQKIVNAIGPNARITQNNRGRNNEPVYAVSVGVATNRSTFEFSEEEEEEERPDTSVPAPRRQSLAIPKVDQKFSI